MLESYLKCISGFPSIINALECLQNQYCLCQTHHPFFKHLVHNILAPVKSLNNIESHILWKRMCSQILYHFVYIPQLIFKIKLSKFQSLVKKFEGYSVRTRQIFLINRNFNRGFVLIDVPFISISFSSVFDCWVIFVLWKPTFLLDKSVHQSAQTLHASFSITAFLKCGITFAQSILQTSCAW